MSRSLLPALLVVGLLGLIVLANSTFIVRQTEIALVFQFNRFERQELAPGLYFKLPLFESVVIYDRRILSVTPDAQEALLADQKQIVVDLFARYRIRDPLLFFQRLSTTDAAEARMETFLNSALRNVLGQTRLENILSDERDDLMAQIRAQVDQQASPLGIEIIDVRISRADLPADISEQTFQRMISERNQDAAEFRGRGQEVLTRLRAQADRDRAIILAEAEQRAQTLRGEGDQEAIRIYAEAFGQDPEFYAFQRSLEAYRTALASPGTTLMLSPDSDFLRFLNADSAQPAGARPATR